MVVPSVRAWGFNNKRSWILCGITFLAAGAVFPFLPKQIPVHWSSGMADGFAEKWAVFLFPALQAGILLVSRIPGVKQWCLVNKTGMEGNESQYYFRIFFIIFLLAFVEGSSILYVLL